MEDGFEEASQIRLPRAIPLGDSILFRFFLTGRSGFFLPHLQFRFDLTDEIDQNTGTD